MSTRRARTSYVLLLLGFLGTLAASATTAPTPINGPVIITTSGDYIVTQDFTANFQPAIKVTGTVNARINLDGHTISAVNAPVVLLHSMVDDAGCRTLAIRDGRIMGGFGAKSQARATACYPQLRLDRVTVQNTDVYVEEGGLVMTSSLVMNGGIAVRAGYSALPIRLEGNTVLSGDITLLAVNGGRVLRNYVRNGSVYVLGTDGLEARNAWVNSNNIVIGNVEIGGDGAGQEASTALIARNRIHGYVMLNQTTGSAIDSNIIGRCGPAATSVEIDGQLNRIDNNTFNGSCDHGIVFDENSTGNEYSYNAFRLAVPEPYLDFGTGNYCGEHADQELGATTDLGLQ